MWDFRSGVVGLPNPAAVAGDLFVESTVDHGFAAVFVESFYFYYYVKCNAAH
jgi:hypothetical protein